MGFLNEIGRKTSEATSRIARETKIKLKTSENKHKILDVYEEMGKKVYEKHVREEEIKIEEDLKEECAVIDELAKEIGELREELLRLQQKKQCPRCNNEMEKEYSYCPNCGKKQDEEPTIFEEASDILESVEIKPQNEREARIVKDELEEKIAEED
ncbi:MAG: zinc ribbon domain-containing protein [Oscillospiraceae bacterium]|nr:zinc ribbon domain-containing protein [Oscillospiraceae bacterium]